MATVGSTPPATSRAARLEEESTAYGWVLFAGTMIAIVGTLNFIYGIAAVSNSKFYIQDAKFVISDLNTWGWVLLVIGAIQMVAAFGIWVQAPFFRWIGVLTASVNAVIQLLVISGYPLLSLALFSLDVLVIYGLIAHGGRPSRA